jgi:hypothetical protein
MLSIKERLLSFYTQRLIKSNKTRRLNVGYQKAQLIGVLYTQTDAQKETIIHQFIERIKKSGKQVQTLVYLPEASSKIQVENHFFSFFTKQEISYLGRWASGPLATFVHTSFDYLYHVDLVSNPILEYVLAKCQAKCRVGHFDIHRASLFEIMIKFDTKPETPALQSLTEDMLHYTQLLKV